MAAVFYKWLLLYGWWLFTGTEQSHTVYKHPFYVAVTEMNLNTSDKTLEVSCKIFADDLEQIIEKINRTQLDISSEKDKPSFDTYIPAYVKKHLTISVDGKSSPISYIGFEKDKESAYCYFQVENISSFKKVDINNSLLHDFITDQVNIIHIMVNGKRQSTKLDYPNKSASFQF